MRIILLAGAALAASAAGPATAQVRAPEGPYAAPQGDEPRVYAEPYRPDDSYVSDDDQSGVDQGDKPDDQAGTCETDGQGAYDDGDQGDADSMEDKGPADQT